jgi:hypothetical protein
MQNQSQTYSHKQKKDQRISAGHSQLQNLIVSQTHSLEQIVQQELDQNPALDFEVEPLDDEDIPIDDDADDAWNQDYDKPYDEYETGETMNADEYFDPVEYDIAENLQRAALEKIGGNKEKLNLVLKQIDHYRLNGFLPDDADNMLQEELVILQKSISYSSLPSSEHTFEVTVLSDSVQANVISTAGDYLICKKGFSKYSDRAEKFIQRINDRTTFLNYLAANVLENIQADFFHQKDLNTALLHLVPIETNTISNLTLENLNLNFSFKLDKQFISKVCDLTVKCEFGVYPFGFFLPSKMALLKLWVKHADENGISTIKDQCIWIKSQWDERITKWDPNDRRRNMIKPLSDLNEYDIKNARKAVAKF